VSVAIHARDGNWGGSPVANVEAVVRSAAEAFAPAFGGDEVAIVVQPTIGDEDAPMVLTSPDQTGAFVVLLNVRGTYWARLAYQFAHELCHVLADPRSFVPDRFAWIEESLCETASLVALRWMARAWAVSPPYPNWRDYSASLAAYEAEHLAQPRRSLHEGVAFRTWLAKRLARLEAEPGRREDATIIARELLPLFEADRAAWGAVRFLHAFPRVAEEPLAGFLARWAAACPPAHRPGATAVASALSFEE
jgi:hypothetical protein